MRLLALNERTRNILTGMVASVLALSTITFGVRAASGALDPTYTVEGLFTSAGQGLIAGSDVKIRGVDIGRVSSVSLEDGRALVRLRIDEGERIPVDATAVIRPKTLFGEKFVDVDPGPGEISGPFLDDGDRITDTVGGFELQKVLNDAYPILEAIDPVDLAVLVGELADGGRDLGPEINRSIANYAAVSDIGVLHDADTRQFLSDLADLSATLGDHADDLMATARDLNVVVPDVVAREDRLTAVLDQASRLSTDVADLLEANQSFLEKNITEGGKTLQLLADEQARIQPLVLGLRQFFQVLAEVIRIPLADGTRLAAVKFVAGGGSPSGQGPPPEPGAATGGGLPPLIEVPAPPVSGAAALERLLGAVLP